MKIYKTERDITPKEASSLLFLFYLNLTITCLFLLLSSATYAQSPCSIKLSTTVQPALCQADGNITCHLSDTLGSTLEQIRYSYFSHDKIDSIIETSSHSLSQFRPGFYKVNVSALCKTNLGYENEYIIISDSVDFVEVTSLYEAPDFHTNYHIFTKEEPYGTVPSFVCQPTGKIQLQIEKGSFPYTVELFKIENEETLFVKSKTFNTYQNSGLISHRFDYYLYYSIDSLEVGKYEILFHDGCDYYAPPAYIEIPEVKSGISGDAHLLRNSSGNPSNYNIISFKELLDYNLHEEHNDEYYIFYDTTFGSLIEYRFINPTQTDEIDTTPWYKLPLHTEQFLFLYDTLSKIPDYGYVWFKDIYLEFRPTYCSDDFWKFHYIISPPAVKYNQTSGWGWSNVITPDFRDYCRYQREYAENASIKSMYYYSYYTNLLLSPDSMNSHHHLCYSREKDQQKYNNLYPYHKYFTFPLKYRIINHTADTIYCFKLHEFQNKNITKLVYLKNPELSGDSVIVEITDLNDCPLYAEKLYIDFDTNYSFYGGYGHDYEWEPFAFPDPYCPDGLHKIKLRQKHSSSLLTTLSDGRETYLYYGDTIQLIKSPMNNFYNFTAYSDTPEYYHVIKEHPENQAFIYYEEDRFESNPVPSIHMDDYGLPEGTYIWRIAHACDKPADTIIYHFNHLHYPVIVEEPAFNFIPHCSKLEIIPTAGQYQINGSNITTYFQIHTLGELYHSTNAVQKNESMFIGVPDTYILSMYALPDNNPDLLSENLCFIKDTIIQWDGNNVKLDYVQSYVCNSADSSGFVRVRGKDGNLPYQYKIYSLPDAMGDLIAQNETGDFDNLPIRANQELSLEISDACDAHFHSNFIVSDLERIRKCWLEDHQNEESFYIGDTCHIYSIALGNVDFHWTGPNNFEIYTPNHCFVIESAAQAGNYRLQLLNTGCGILSDSLQIYVNTNKKCPDAIDFDGNQYPAIRINGVCWTTQNLRSTHYSDGRSVRMPLTYHSDLHPNHTDNLNTYGHLYTWYESIDTATLGAYTLQGHVQGICPDGWYLPEEYQYDELAQHGALALRTPHLWISTLRGNNHTGFSALPAGFYNGARNRFENLLGETRFWFNFHATSNTNSSDYYLKYSCEELQSDLSFLKNGYSIRCILEE